MSKAKDCIDCGEIGVLMSLNKSYCVECYINKEKKNARKQSSKKTAAALRKNRKGI